MVRIVSIAVLGERQLCGGSIFPRRISIIKKNNGLDICFLTKCNYQEYIQIICKPMFNLLSKKGIFSTNFTFGIPVKCKVMA